MARYFPVAQSAPRCTKLPCLHRAPTWDKCIDDTAPAASDKEALWVRRVTLAPKKRGQWTTCRASRSFVRGQRTTVVIRRLSIRCERILCPEPMGFGRSVAVLRFRTKSANANAALSFSSCRISRASHLAMQVGARRWSAGGDCFIRSGNRARTCGWSSIEEPCKRPADRSRLRYQGSASPSADGINDNRVLGLFVQKASIVD
jgi:hypothetical protein